VLANRSWRHADGELEQKFVGDALLTPGWIRAIQLLDDLPEATRQRRTTAFSRLPSPEHPKGVPVPFDEGGWFHDYERLAPLKESSQSEHR
jgi:hypothetical protein